MDEFRNDNETTEEEIISTELAEAREKSAMERDVENLEAAEKLVTITENQIDELLDQLEELPAEKRAELQADILALSSDLKNFKHDAERLNDAHERLFQQYESMARGLRDQISFLEAKGKMDIVREKREELVDLLQSMKEMTGSRKSTDINKIAAKHARNLESIKVKPLDARPLTRGAMQEVAPTELITDATEGLVKSDQKELMDDMVRLGAERDNLRALGDEAGAMAAEQKRLEKKVVLQKLWAEEDEREAAG